METIRELLRRLSYLIHRNRRRDELAAETDFHREMTVRAGRPEARRRFGNPALLQERAREAWGWQRRESCGAGCTGSVPSIQSATRRPSWCC